MDGVSDVLIKPNWWILMFIVRVQSEKIYLRVNIVRDLKFGKGQRCKIQLHLSSS